MDRDWLERELASGRSIESLAREVGRSASTVAYWVKKYGLESSHAERHAARGGIDRYRLAELVERGLSTRGIAAELGCSQATVRHWLMRYGLRTERAPRAAADARSIQRTCARHGRTTFVRYGPNDHFRCESCRKERVVARRRRVKEILVQEAGGACVLCGYDRCAGALHFHHLDPAEKSFGWPATARPGRWRVVAPKPRSACWSARTAMPRSKPASLSYIVRRAPRYPG